MKNIEDESILNFDESVSRKLDEKVMELHSLFELSQTLNSSLNVTTILDNLLLTPMGKMMITKGIVLLSQKDNQYAIKTLKGLPQNLIGQKFKIDFSFSNPKFLNDIKSENGEWVQILQKLSIELIIPIKSSQQNLGIIGFSKKISGQPYIQPELDFLKSLSNIAATAIENGLMVLQLQDVNRKLDKKVQELNTIFDIGKELNSTLDPGKIVNLLSYAIMGEMMVNRLLVFLKKENKMELATSKGHKNKTELEKYEDHDFLRELLTINNTINVKKNRHKSPALSLFENDGFQVIVPMKLHNTTRGIIAVSEKIIKTEWTRDEEEFLFTLGNEAMICLENARLFEEMLEKQRMEEELDIAREIQQGLLPKKCATLKEYEIVAMNVPSQQVGGDYYDCIDLEDDNICLAIADVSGKGIPASLLMANMQASLHATIESDRTLSEITRKINNIIHKNTGYDKFITFFCGILDTKNHKFISVNAGHNPPYVFHKDGSFGLLSEGGLILGMMPNMPYQQESTTLECGDWIIMYTDGVSEAKNKFDEDFEEFRIEEIVRKHLHASASEMKDHLYNAIKEFSTDVPQSDDITMILVKVIG